MKREWMGTYPGGSLTEAGSVVLSCLYTVISVKNYFLSDMPIGGIDLIN